MILQERKAEVFDPKTKLGILHRGIANYDEIRRIGKCPKLSFSTVSEADYCFDLGLQHVLKSGPDNANIPISPLSVPENITYTIYWQPSLSPDILICLGMIFKR